MSESTGRPRAEIDPKYRWNLSDIFPSWESWQTACDTLDGVIERFAALKGSLNQGPEQLLEALRLEDELGQLSYKVWYYPSLRYDEDQRDNAINAKRQQVQILMAKAAQATSWFNPELLAIPLETVRQWMTDDPQGLELYRFAVEDLYRQQEHVLDEPREALLSLAARFSSAPPDIYGALSTADIKFPTITLSDGEQITVTYGRYRALLATNRNQSDRKNAFEALYHCYGANINTYAAIYNGIAQRDWFAARARNYRSTLEAALHGNNIPTSVVETLIETTKRQTAPLQRYHQLRKRVLGVDKYYLYDGSIPLVESDKQYPYDDVLDQVIESVAPLGSDYQGKLRQALSGGWIDVYENQGKRSGAYSAGVYGVHPYILLNYNNTLDDVFTLAHELGHAMHTLLSAEAQPFRYASYTIFVAEVASTFNEALLLDYMIEREADRLQRAVLLQHAIDSILGTFYTQVLFANWELDALRMVENGEPLTADALNTLYRGLVDQYYGDAIDKDPRYDWTWSRIPHFFRSPYYVYQYATCHASSAQLFARLRTDRQQTTAAYLDLLSSGGSDYPMDQLKAAGIDLSQSDTIAAVGSQLDRLITQLEAELKALDRLPS
ncbi:MAG: oligoendopeptidase F [Deltaproteobacteria bacterium]|nr:oligoendopeptidase F [Deltaproteobacteria bacterium]